MQFQQTSFSVSLACQVLYNHDNYLFGNQFLNTTTSAFHDSHVMVQYLTVLSSSGKTSIVYYYIFFFRLSKKRFSSLWDGNPANEDRKPWLTFECFATGGLPHLGGWTPGLLWTGVLHTTGGSSVGPVSWRGGLRPSLCHVLLHGQLGGLCGLFAPCSGLETKPSLCLPGRSGRVPLLPPHLHLHLQRAHHHEGVRGTLVCQWRFRGEGIVAGVGHRHDGKWPMWHAPLLLLPAQVQAAAPEVRTAAVPAENLLVHDAGHLQELPPRPEGDEAAVRGSALQLDGGHVFYAFLHRLCGGRPLRGRAQRITRKCVQAKIRRRLVFSSTPMVYNVWVAPRGRGNIYLGCFMRSSFVMLHVPCVLSLWLHPHHLSTQTGSGPILAALSGLSQLDRMHPHYSDTGEGQRPSLCYRPAYLPAALILAPVEV